jgi:CRP/FNR family transcriptional regulator, anaerobic regulatory protein
MNTEELWRATYPDFAKSDDPHIQRLMTESRVVEVPSEKTIFQPGSQCGNYYLLIDGSIRVFVLTSSGREVLLYRVTQGQGCVITTSCLLGEDPYNVFGISDTTVSAFAIPSTLFHETLTHSEAFRTYVFRGFAHRLSCVLARLEDLVEGDIDQMLAETLIAQSQESTVTVTHQKLADQIGTAREVISRHLKNFEKKGWIALSRGLIQILNVKALEEFSRNHSHSHVKSN